MGIVFAFVVGYVAGARAGAERLEEIRRSLQAVSESGEFQDLLRALRLHASEVLNDVSRLLAESGDTRLTVQDIFDKVRSVVQPEIPTSGAS